MTLSTDSQLTINIDAHHATSADLKTRLQFKGLLKKHPKGLEECQGMQLGYMCNCMVKKSLYIYKYKSIWTMKKYVYKTLPITRIHRSHSEDLWAKRLWRDTNGAVQVSTRLPPPLEHPLIHVAHQRLSHPHRWHHQILRRPLRRCCLLPWRLNIDMESQNGNGVTI